MPSKSRRSRRNIPPKNPITNNTETAGQASTRSYSPPAAKPERITPISHTPATPIYPNVLNEIKWIAIVTAIVVAILIVLYYTVR